MASVDNRVVKMEFDNRSFQQKIGVTTDSLAKLKASLNFSKSSDSLKEVSNTANGINLSSLSSSVSTATSGFNILAGAAAVALGGIATKAAMAGAQIAKSFTIAPISEGFKEYETNMQSVQTILANTATKGTTLDDVNAALDKLNKYSDQTIYNFGQMAKNIGTFTAAGVDLDTSVNSIKGIANLAALSGSSAEQASNAMYQLSQAISTGSLKLMDWNSITNAGMGGEAFKTTLFETAKAMGTLSNVPMGQSFAEWEKANGSFRDSLESGWISSDVLTTALSTFTGDMNEEMLLQKGFSQQQATLLLQQAARAKAAATEVKTFSQLLGTVKESVGTGWADSFKIVIGNFTEAKALFTQVNTVISGIVGRSADARNEMLGIWKNLGGRDKLIAGIGDAFKALGKIIVAVKAAFQTVFPPMTGARLLELTEGFQRLVKALTPSQETLTLVFKAFKGVFSVVAIVFEVIKNLANTFVVLFSSISKGSRALEFFAKLGDALFNLKRSLVDGGGISKFFDNITESLSGLIGKGFEVFFDVLGGFAGRAADRFGFLSKAGGPLAASFTWISEKIGELIAQLAKLLSFVQNQFSGVTDGISGELGDSNFSSALDAVNTGLFAGLILLIRKFVKDGLSFDIGGGLISNISKSFEQLSGTLSAMEKSIKADAILKIAIALGVLTLSLLVLSTIDSANLTKALIAVGVAFGMLAGMLALLGKINTGFGSSVNIGILAGSLILLAGAMLILALAAKVFASMSWAELAKGLIGVAALLFMVTEAVKRMPDGKKLLSTGIGLAAIAVAIRILVSSVQVLGSMDFAQLLKGLLGVGILLAALVAVVKLMPTGTELMSIGAGLLLFSIAVGVLTGAVYVLGTMNFDDLKQGMLALGLLLGALVVVINQMPDQTKMIAIGVGLILIADAMLIMVAAVAGLGAMDLSKMIQGLAGVAAMLIILAVAVQIMQSGIAGAITIAILAGSLLVLSIALNAFAQLSWGQLLTGLAMIGALILTLAIAANALAPAIPALIGLGVALVLIGAGVALVSVGVLFLAKAIQILQEQGRKGISTLVQVFNVVIMQIPKLVEALGTALIQLANKLVAALPGLINGLGVALIALLNKLREILPVFLQLVGDIISGILNLIREKVPEYIATGLFLLVSFLDGIRKNIGLIVIMVGEIIVNFINALATEIPRIIAAGVNLLTKLIEGVSSVMYLVGGASATILASFIEGLTAGVATLIRAGTDLIVTVITGIGNAMDEIVTAGADTIVKFLQGLSNNIQKVVDAGWDFIIDLIRGIRQSIRDNMPTLIEEFKGLAGDLIQGLKDGLTGSIGSFGGIIGDIGQSILDSFTGFFDIFSPSKKTRQIGGYLIDGLAVGLSDSTAATNAATSAGDNVMTALSDTLLAISASFNSLDELNPVITPVLDLTNVERGAARLNDIMGVPKIDASLSFGQAASISMAATTAKDATTQPVQTTNEIKFEQIINAPTALSTNDIYRNTKTQISMAKEELKIT
jgi:tape measure domain-containing protein